MKSSSNNPSTLSASRSAPRTTLRAGRQHKGAARVTVMKMKILSVAFFVLEDFVHGRRRRRLFRWRAAENPNISLCPHAILALGMLTSGEQKSATLKAAYANEYEGLQSQLAQSADIDNEKELKEEIAREAEDLMLGIETHTAEEGARITQYMSQKGVCGKKYDDRMHNLLDFKPDDETDGKKSPSFLEKHKKKLQKMKKGDAQQNDDEQKDAEEDAHKKDEQKDAEEEEEDPEVEKYMNRKVKNIPTDAWNLENWKEVAKQCCPPDLSQSKRRGRACACTKNGSCCGGAKEDAPEGDSK
ncbi:unnamed protein product [Amoebophrya sp. A25]|nr:unnamed protein product [Amoebophrya sp. A25]|eukprot:GSA25T00001437001.1